MHSKHEKHASLIVIVAVIMFLLYYWKKHNPSGSGTVFGYLPPSLGGPLAPGATKGGGCNNPDVKAYRENLAPKQATDPQSASLFGASPIRTYS
jgi:hypothetical protein